MTILLTKFKCFIKIVNMTMKIQQTWIIWHAKEYEQYIHNIKARIRKDVMGCKHKKMNGFFL